MKTLIVLLTLALVPCLAQQAAANEDKVVLQQGTEGDVEVDERTQFWTGIATNAAKILGIGVSSTLVLLIVAALFRWLWNITVPDVFGLKEITLDAEDVDLCLPLPCLAKLSGVRIPAQGWFDAERDGGRSPLLPRLNVGC